MTRGPKPGTKFTEEHKQKLSIAAKGKSRSEATKQKISESHKGKKMHPNTKQALLAANLGRKLSDEHIEKLKSRKLTKEHIEKLAEARKRKGVSVDTRQKISQKLRGKYYMTADGKARMIEANTGKTVSEETRHKISVANTGRKMSEDAIKKRSAHVVSDATRQKQSEAQQRRFAKSEERQKISDSVKAKNYKHTDEAKIRISAAMTERMKDPERRSEAQSRLQTEQARLKRAAATKAYATSPEGRLKNSMAQQRRFQDPLQKEKMTAILMNNSHPRNYKSGHHDSVKAGRVHYRSSYELKLYELLDKCDVVATYMVEFESVQYNYDGKVCLYYPDVKVLYINGNWSVLEVKPSSVLNSKRNIAKFDAAVKVYGNKFSVITEKELFGDNFPLAS